MAAVSEVTTTRIVQSYVSSNSYYGYVPPINETTTTTTTTAIKLNNNQYLYNSQQSKVYFNNTKSDERTYQSHQQQQQQQQQYNENNGLAMETDDIDNNHYNGDYKLHCQNNHYVIPEMVMRLDNNNKINSRSNSVGDPGGRGIEDSVGFIYRMNHSDADAAYLHNNNNNNNNINTNNNNNIYNYNHNNGMVNSMEIHRRNRKRNNYDHAEVDQEFSHGQLKKFRPDGGNKRVYRNTRSCTGDIGSSAVHNEPTTHLVSNSVCSIPIQSQVVSFSCNNVNGNPSVLQSPGKSREIDPVQLYDIRVSARDNKRADRNSSVLPVTSTNKNNIVDYETMLMETHGCLAYHLYRHQFLDINTFEAEF